MAYPVIAANSSGGTTTNSTTTTITLPTGSNIGDTCILIFVKDGSDTPGTPSDWSVVAQSVDAGAASHFSIFTAVLVSTNNFMVTHASEMAAWICLRFTTALSIEVNSVARGSSTAPASTSLTHTFGAGDEVMWITVAGWDYQRTVTAYPTSFTDNRISSIATNNNAAGTGMATLNSLVNPQNPDAFTISATDTWCAYTLAVKVQPNLFMFLW